jgi:hypothetical protein
VDLGAPPANDYDGMDAVLMELLVLALVFIAGFGIGLALGMFWLIKPREARPCSHGYENWDDCPDCCH